MNYLPAPPTDNLYKFFAIAGLWIVLAVIAYFAYLTYLGHMSGKESNEYLSYMRSIAKTEDINYRIEQHKTGSATKENRPDWMPQHLTLADESTYLSSLLNAQQRIISDYEKTPHIYGEKLDLILAVPIYATLSVLILGGVLMVFGFFGWHEKVQRPQNELIALELELKKSLISKTTAEIKQLSKPRFSALK